MTTTLAKQSPPGSAAITLAGKLTQPGIYENISDDDYHADPVDGGSMSSTGARRIMAPGCPAKFRYAQLHPEPPKREFDFGKAAHHLVLGIGPDLVVVDADDWRTKRAQQERDAARAEGKVPLLPHEYDQVEDMAEALRRDPVASQVLAPGTGRKELTLVWRDVRTGVWCRARIDWLRDDLPDGRSWVVDYKTAAKADLESIQKAIADRGYHQQLDWYCGGALETGLAQNPVPLLVFQEKKPPYLVTVTTLTTSTLEWGRVINDAAVELYAECLRTDTWPGYATQIVASGVPGYVDHQYQIALERGDFEIKGKKRTS